MLLYLRTCVFSSFLFFPFTLPFNISSFASIVFQLTQYSWSVIFYSFNSDYIYFSIFSCYCYFKFHITSFLVLFPFSLVPDLSYCCKPYFLPQYAVFLFLTLNIFPPSTLAKAIFLLTSAHIPFPPLIIVLFPLYHYKLWLLGE